MAFAQNQIGSTFYAKGSIYPMRFAKFYNTSATDQVIQSTANAKIVGVTNDSTHDPDTSYAADSGDPVQLIVGGIAKVVCGAAVSVGDRVKSDSTGRAVKTGGGKENVAGIARSATSAAGEIVMIQLEFGQVYDPS